MSRLRRIWWEIRHAIGGCHMSRCRMVKFVHGDYLECQDCYRQWLWQAHPRIPGEPQ